jgi:hypothetical protein
MGKGLCSLTFAQGFKMPLHCPPDTFSADRFDSFNYAVHPIRDNYRHVTYATTARLGQFTIGLV